MNYRISCRYLLVSLFFGVYLVSLSAEAHNFYDRKETTRSTEEESPSSLNNEGISGATSTDPEDPARLIDLTRQVTRLEAAYQIMLKGESYELLTVPEQIRQFGYDQFSNYLSEDQTGIQHNSSLINKTSHGINSNFSLVPGDTLRISVYGNSDLEIEGILDHKGDLFLPKIGPISLRGVPFEKAESKIRDRVEKHYVGSKVHILLLGQGNRSVSIFGKVARPGTRTLSGMGTIMDALASAGGILPTGSLRNIKIQLGQHSRMVDLYGSLTGRGEGLHLRGGEVIHVPPIGQTVALVGETLEPGIYESVDGETLSEFLSKVAQLTPLANPNSINIHRSHEVDQRVDVFSLRREDRQFKLESYDVISIPSRVHEKGQLLSISGAIKSPGSYQYRPGINLKELIDLAGGLTRLHSSRVQIKRPFEEPRYQKGKDGHLIRIEHHIIDVSVKKTSLIQTMLQKGDDISIPVDEPDLVPATVNILGEILNPGAYPFSEGMNLHQLLTRAGGISEDANLEGTTIARYNKEGDVEIFLKEQTSLTLEVELKGITLIEGDVITIPTRAKTGIIVISEGEFLRPGTYHLPKGAKISDLIAISGGLSDVAFVRGASFFRESVAKTFNTKLNSLADRLEEDLLRSQKATIESSLQSQDKKNEAIFLKQERLVQRLRDTRSPGRVAIDMLRDLETFKNSPHNLILEDGDRLKLPSTPSTVSVLGQVYNPNTLAWQPDLRPADYLAATGGVTRSADDKNIYILKANGRVIPFQQVSKRGGFNWITGRGSSMNLHSSIGPGDSILVPEDFEIKQNRLQVTKDVSQIMFQIIAALGVVVAAF